MEQYDDHVIEWLAAQIPWEPSLNDWLHIDLQQNFHVIDWLADIERKTHLSKV